MRKGLGRWFGFCVPVVLVAGVLQAQGPAQLPPGAMAPASKDPAAAPPGDYHIDLEHAAVVARVSHRGISYSVLRFGVRNGTLRWNPAKPSDIALDVTVDAKPYYAPIVYKIPPEGPMSLNVAEFPDAKFVSTAVHVTGNAKAEIEGRLTLMGVTKPVTIEAALVGVGRSMEGAPTVGFTGTMNIDTADFTDKLMARMVGRLTVILDAEFIKS